MKFLSLLFFLFLANISQAQILKKLKDKVKNRAKYEVENAKYEAKQKARQTARNELEGIKADFDSTDIDYAILVSDNAGLFGVKGKGSFGAKFLRLGGIAKSMYRDFDLDDEENANLNLQMGQSAYAMGRFVFAEKRYNAAKYYFERSGRTGELNYLKTIAGLGLLYTNTSRFQLANEYTDKALQLRTNRLGANSMAVASSLNNYAVLHYNLGLYNEAEKEFEQSVNIIKQNNQQATMPYAIVLNNKAMLFQTMGNYEAAIKLLNDVLQLIDQLPQSKSNNELKFLSNMGLLYQQMNQYSKAESIYQQLDKKLANNSVEKATMLNNYAVLLMLMKQDEKVESMLQQSADIFKNTLGESSPAYAKVISDLGNFYRYKKRYDDATPLLQQALQIREQTLGVDHPMYVQSQEDEALLLWKKNDLAAAIPLYKTVMQKTIDFINNYFAPMSDAEKTKYWDLLSPRFQRFYNFALDAQSTDQSILQDLFAYRVATKGILLNSAEKISKEILHSQDQQLVSDYINWIDHKEQLARLYVYSKKDLEEQNVNIDSLENEVNNMEKRLSENSTAFANFYFSEKINYNEIQSKLGGDEALVEIIRLQKFDGVLTNSCRYVGLVVTNDQSNPQVVVIDDGDNLEDQRARTYRVMMKNKIKDEKSYAYFWQPFAAKLENKKTVYLSLDGVYDQVNLNTLKPVGGDFLIQQYNFVLLSNPRDVLKRNSEKLAVNNKKATLIGFPDYGKGVLVALPGTKVEVEEINKVLKTSGYQVAELMQQEATESNLKSAKEISILHIATHGYFLKDVTNTSWPIGVHKDFAKDNVLLRSGLMLTGAAEADQLKPGLENNNNGIITSYEAMNLDLTGTDLVVLSACETGLGEVKAGEGVYGLQRAFLVAGADAIIMSLWKVDDKATQQLMNNFYKNLMKDDNKQKAFRDAQLQLMTTLQQPLYWGAFVMMEN